MYAELIYAEAKLAEMRGQRRAADHNRRTLPGVEIRRPDPRIKHEVFRRIVQQ